MRAARPGIVERFSIFHTRPKDLVIGPLVFWNAKRRIASRCQQEPGKQMQLPGCFVTYCLSTLLGNSGNLLRQPPNPLPNVSRCAGKSNEHMAGPIPAMALYDIALKSA